MGYLLAGAFIGSLTTFSAMVLVICADTKKYEAENKRLKEQLNNLIAKYESEK